MSMFLSITRSTLERTMVYKYSGTAKQFPITAEPCNENDCFDAALHGDRMTAWQSPFTCGIQKPPRGGLRAGT